MKEESQQLLHKHEDSFMTQLYISRAFLAELVTKHVIKQDQKEEILAEPTNSDKVDKLLDILSCRPESCFEDFCKSLKNENEDLYYLLFPDLSDHTKPDPGLIKPDLPPPSPPITPHSELILIDLSDPTKPDPGLIPPDLPPQSPPITLHSELILIDLSDPTKPDPGLIPPGNVENIPMLKMEEDLPPPSPTMGPDPELNLIVLSSNTKSDPALIPPDLSGHTESDPGLIPPDLSDPTKPDPGLIPPDLSDPTKPDPGLIPPDLPPPSPPMEPHPELNPLGLKPPPSPPIEPDPGPQQPPAHLSEIHAAIEAGNDVIKSVKGLYENAINVYDMKYNRHATVFTRRLRSLELAIINGCSKELKFSEAYFNSGTCFVAAAPQILKPGEVSIVFVANCEYVPSGVTGGLDYSIEDTDGLHLYTGFTNPLLGSYKNFIQVEKNKSAKWAYDNAKDDSVKKLTSNGFDVTCKIRTPRRSSFKMFEYTITDSGLTKIPYGTQPAEQFNNN